MEVRRKRVDRAAPYWGLQQQERAPKLLLTMQSSWVTGITMAGPAAIAKLMANKRSLSMGAQKTIGLYQGYQAGRTRAISSLSSSCRSWSAFLNSITTLVLKQGKKIVWLVFVSEFTKLCIMQLFQH